MHKDEKYFLKFIFFSHIPDDKINKYNLYSGLLGRPLVVAHGARVPSPHDQKDLSPTKDHAASSSSTEDSASPSPVFNHTESPPRSLSSSDPESGSEAEKPRDCPSLERDPTEIMAKIFPHHTRHTLESIVRTCKGDIVRSIELLLNSKESKIDPDALAQSGLTCAPRPPVGLPGVLGTLGGKSAFSPLHVSPAAAGGDSLYGLSPRLGVSPLRLAYSSASGSMTGFMSPYMTSGLMPVFPLRPPLDSYSFPSMIRDFSYLQSKESLCSTGLYTQPTSEK